MPRFTHYDRSELYSSLNSSTQMARKNAAAKNTYSRAKNSTFLERRNIARHERDTKLWSDLGRKIGTAAISVATGDISPIVGDKLASLITKGQASEANVEMLDWITAGKGIAQQSIADGSSTFTADVDADGNSIMSFKPSEAVTAWYEDTLKKIDESGYLPAVKDSMRQNLASNYYSMVQGMQASAIEKAYSNIESGFQTEMSAAIVSDAQLYAEYDGRLPEGMHYKGVAVIAARDDWDIQTKGTRGAEYTMQVQKAGIQERATRIATSQGLEELYDYVYSQQSLNDDEKRSVYSKAKTSYDQMSGAYVSEAESMMETAYTDPAGSTPYDVYKWIDDISASKGLPSSVTTDMKDIAKTKQLEAVTTMGQNTLMIDKGEGLSALYDGLAEFKSDKHDAWFYGMPEEKQKLITNYETAIAEDEKKIATELDTSIENVQKMDKNVIERYEEANKAAFDLFKAGAITGREYGQIVTDNSIVALGESQTKDNVITAGWQTALTTTIDEYVEDTYSGEVKNKVEALLIAEGKLDSSKNKWTAEDLALVNDLIAEVNGSILNAVWDYGRKAVPIESVLDFVDKAYQSYVLRASVLGKDDESNIPSMTDDGVTMKKLTKRVTASNAKITSDPEASYVWYDHAEAYADSFTTTTDENGQITIGMAAPGMAAPKAHFMSESVETEYRRTASFYRSQAAMACGIDESLIMDNPEAVGENAAIASPVLTFRDGTILRCRGRIMQKFIDTGEQGDGKGRWVPYIQINDDGIDPYLINEKDREALGEPDKNKPFTVSDSNVGDYIKLEMETGSRGPEFRGITVNPEILNAVNYSISNIRAAAKSSPALDVQWPLIVTELRRLEAEKNSKEEEE